MRAQAYAELGIGTICRTTMMADALLGALGQPGGGEPSIREGAGHPHATAGRAAGHSRRPAATGEG